MVAITHPGALCQPRRQPAAVYTRRRLAVLGLVALVLAGALLLAELTARFTAAGEPAPLRPVAEVAVVVQPGDTVWSIATDLARGGDPRPIVDAIADANGGAALEAGQRLVLRLP
jgi:hypothetical protein